jgi:hypothetical protein
MQIEADFSDIYKQIDDAIKMFGPLKIQEALLDTLAELYSNVKDRVPYDTGELYNSWVQQVAGVNTVEGAFDVIYAAYQHRGSRADGSYTIKNRPAGGETNFLFNEWEENEDYYIDYFLSRLQD